MVLPPELISQIIVGLLLAIGTLGVRWSNTGKKHTKRIRTLESRLERSLTFIYAQRDRSRLHNDKFHPPTSKDPDSLDRIKLVEIPEDLRVTQQDEDGDSQ